MPEIERILVEKLNVVYRAHYALWVHWWPAWRALYSGPRIVRKWKEIGLVKDAQTFLDFGCGTGTFSFAAARVVGNEGKVYALDCFPRQLEIVKKKSRKQGLKNIETILSSMKTGLPDESIDIIWVCDVLHEIPQRRAVIEELHRVLKRKGILAIYDGMREKTLEYTAGLFSLAGQDDKLLRFAKTTRNE